MSSLALALALSLQQPEPNSARVVFPQTSIGDAITPAQAPELCNESLASANELSSMPLLRGSASCAFIGRDGDSSFLLNIGLIRGSVDYLSLLPADSQATDQQQELLLILYYNASHVGSDDVLRDDQKRELLVQRVNEWRPSFNASYEPGWDVGERATELEYSVSLNEMLQAKLAEISRVTILVNDPEYWALHQERAILLERLEVAEEQDPADLARLSEIQALKVERAAELGDPAAVAMLSSRDRDPLEQRMARVAPEPNLPSDATILDHSDAGVVSRCRQAAKRDALGSDGRVLTEVISEEEGIGIVYRADVEDGPSAMYPGVTRHYCSSNFTGSTPLDATENLLPAL